MLDLGAPDAAILASFEPDPPRPQAPVPTHRPGEPEEPHGEEPYRPRPDDAFVEPFFGGLAPIGSGNPEPGPGGASPSRAPESDTSVAARIRARGWRRAVLWSLVTLVVALLLHFFGE